MSRNDERLGAPIDLTPAENSAGASPVQNMNSYMPPTTFVELPTEGKFYPENHPLHNKSCVEIRYMTTQEEDILTNKELLKKGLAVDRLLSGLILDKSIQIESLFNGDKSALIIGARITGFGQMYEPSVGCQKCGELNELSYNLNEVKHTKCVDTDTVSRIGSEGHFKTTLPVTGMTVVGRLLKGVDELKTMQINEKKKKHGLKITPNIDFLENVIVSINDITDLSQIKQIVQNLPTLDSRFIKQMYKRMNPTVEMDIIFECSTCGVHNQTEVPMTSDFFWPTIK